VVVVVVIFIFSKKECIAMHAKGNEIIDLVNSVLVDTCIICFM